MEVSGKVHHLGEEQQVTSTFKKRELVVATMEQYPQHILIEFKQDKCDLLNNCNVGDNIKVSINILGREWTNPQGETKYFNSIQGWNISKVQDAEVTVIKSDAIKKATDMIDAAFEPATNLNEEDYDDLPF